jgi:5-bromo-4-chloroindolyl phosphate hydrolysis protein
MKIKIPFIEYESSDDLCSILGAIIITAIIAVAVCVSLNIKYTDHRPIFYRTVSENSDRPFEAKKK